DEESDQNCAQRLAWIKRICGHRHGGCQEQHHDGYGHGPQATEDILDETQVVQAHKFFRIANMLFLSLGRWRWSCFLFLLRWGHDKQGLFLVPPGRHQQLRQQRAACGRNTFLKFPETRQISDARICKVGRIPFRKFHASVAHIRQGIKGLLGPAIGRSLEEFLQTRDGMIHAFHLPGNYLIAYVQHIPAHPPYASPGKTALRRKSSAQRQTIEKREKASELIPYLEKPPSFDNR